MGEQLAVERAQERLEGVATALASDEEEEDVWRRPAPTAVVARSSRLTMSADLPRPPGASMSR